MRIEEFTLKNGRRGWKLTLEAPKDPATGKRRRIIERVYAPFKDGARGVERYTQRRQTEIDAQGASFIKPVKDTLAAYLTHWLEGASRDLQPTTAASYGQMVRCHIIPALGAVPLADLAPFHVQDFLDAMRSGTGPEGEPVGPRTAAYARTVLRIALQEAVRLGLIASNPVDRTRGPKQYPRRVEAFTPEQMAALLKAAEGTRMRNLLEFAWLSAMRRGEILALKWTDVDMDRGTVVVQRSRVKLGGRGVEKAPKTEAGCRVVVLPERAVDVLRRQWVKQAEDKLAAGPAYQDEGYVFATAEGHGLSPDNVSRDYRRCHDKAKVGEGEKAIPLPELPFHALRHSGVSLQLAAGIPLEIVSKRIGHKRRALTADTYGHLLPEANLEAAQRVDEFLSRAVGGSVGHQKGTNQAG